MRQRTFRITVTVLLTATLALVAYIAATGTGMKVYCSNSGPGECVTQWQDGPGQPQP
jgi:hypothetical protein